MAAGVGDVTAEICVGGGSVGSVGTTGRAVGGSTGGSSGSTTGAGCSMGGGAGGTGGGGVTAGGTVGGGTATTEDRRYQLFSEPAVTPPLNR
ncbi:hypothetical protein D3C81_1889830 [compost metagenome]